MEKIDKSNDFYELATRCLSHNEDIVLTVKQAESIVWAANKLTDAVNALDVFLPDAGDVE